MAVTTLAVVKQKVHVRGIAAVYMPEQPAIPAVLPFLVFDDALLALRVAYALLVGMLFFIGYRWACETNANRWLSGFAIASSTST